MEKLTEQPKGIRAFFVVLLCDVVCVCCAYNFVLMYQFGLGFA